MNNAPQVVQTISSVASLLAILGIGAKLLRHAARVELKIDLMWQWFAREHNIESDS